MSNTKNFSASEAKIFSIVEKAGKIDTGKLTKAFYGKNQPVYGRVVVSGLIRALERKTARGDARLKRTKRQGPYPMSVWIERKAS